MRVFAGARVNRAFSFWARKTTKTPNEKHQILGFFLILAKTIKQKKNNSNWIYIYITQTLLSYTHTRARAQVSDVFGRQNPLLRSSFYTINACTKSIDNPHIPTCIYLLKSTAYIYITINNMNNYMVSFVMLGWRRPPGKRRVTSPVRVFRNVGSDRWNGRFFFNRLRCKYTGYCHFRMRTCVPCTIVRHGFGCVAKRSDGPLSERAWGSTRRPMDISRNRPDERRFWVDRKIIPAEKHDDRRAPVDRSVKCPNFRRLDSTC